MTTAKRRPKRTVVRPVAAPGITDFVNERLTGRFELDAQGFDRELAAVCAPLANLRWNIDVDGADLIPNGTALVVHSQRLGISEPWVVAAAFRELGREIRPVGLPDRQPLRSAFARAGWISSTAADIRAVLRAGSFPAIGLGRSPRFRHRPGALDPELMQAAIDLRVPVLPIAVVGRETGRRWQLVVGAPVATRTRATLTPAELANRSRERVAQLLEAAHPHLLPF